MKKGTMAVVKEITKVESSQVRNDLKRLKTEIEAAYTQVARLLWRALHDTVGGVALFSAWGYASFEDYAAGELGMKRGKGYYLAQIWEELHVKAEIPESKIKQLDWAHSKELASLARVGGLSTRNIDKWTKKASVTPVPQFAEEVKAARQAHVSGTSIPVETVHRITVGLYGAQYENFEKAMEIAGQLARSDKQGHLLDLVCTEFLAQYVGQKNIRSKALKRYVAMIERGFGVRIIVVDPDTDKIVAGKDMAKELGVE